MIKSIRGRIQLWYGGVYALSILVFGCFVYWRAARDMNERAVLQAVSTAQYLDVSLRTFRSGSGRGVRAAGQSSEVTEQIRRDAGDVRENSGTHVEASERPAGDPFPDEFSLGPLPPEFQFGLRGGAPPGRHSRQRLTHNLRDDSSLGGGRREAGILESDRTQSEPDASMSGSTTYDTGPGPLGSERSRAPDAPRPPIDRMGFVIFRSNGAVLFRSEGDLAERFLVRPPIIDKGPPLLVSSVHGGVQVTLKGPAETTILVLRPIGNDVRRLHHFGYQISGMAISTLLIGLFGGRWVSGRMVRPIQLISDTASQISATNLNHRIERSQIDGELVQLADVLNGMFERLEQSFGRLTQFTADASHELRTPLAVIQSQMELALSRPRSSESYQQTLATCLRSSERMRLLIEDLLLLARTDSQRSELRFQEIDLRQVAEDAILRLADKAAAAGVELKMSRPNSVVAVYADKRFLTQVPVNLIDNAIQHSTTGDRVSVDVYSEDSKAVLTVRDHGSGIAAEHLPRLFERFYRVDTARSREHGGSGLGLPICKSLVETFGGSIACESTLESGTMFVVYLPLHLRAGGEVVSEEDA